MSYFFSKRDQDKSLQLKALRLDAGYSLAQLSELTNIHVKRLTSAENNLLARWLTSAEIEKLSEVLQANPSQLI